MNRTIVTIDWKKPVTRVLRSGRSRTPREPRRRGRRAHRRPASPAPPPNRATAASSSAGMPVKPSVPSRNRATATSSAAMSAAEARGPSAPRLARDPQRREARLVRRAEVEPAGGDEVGRRGRRRPAVGVGQRVLDGKSHVGGAQLGLEGAVDEPDGRVDDALRMDDDLDGVVADIVQPVRLDDLQALVRERRRVDRDLGAHRPGRVAEGLGRGRPRPGSPRRRRGTARPTRSGSARRRSPSTRRRATARWRSAPSRSACSQASGLAYGSPGRIAACAAARSRASGITRWPPATSVSLLAVATILPARSAARTGRRLTTPPVPTTTRSTSSRVASRSSASGPPTRSVPAGRSSPASAGAIAQGDRGRTKARGLLREQAGVRAGRERDDPECLRMRVEDLDGLAADRAGRAEERDAARPVPSSGVR